jgi:hypothetical protein
MAKLHFRISGYFGKNIYNLQVICQKVSFKKSEDDDSTFLAKT